ncbi:MAG: hypothetical protein BRD49_04605 [Bacteroidetes bacterium SW_10_40_5]|nr:MAG: hypothetical protein BRD49_04605 [Bacteroidetes bacterium SW_10_40_5]
MYFKNRKRNKRSIAQRNLVVYLLLLLIIMGIYVYLSTIDSGNKQPNQHGQRDTISQQIEPFILYRTDYSQYKHAYKLA